MKQTATEFLFEKLWETPKDKLTWNALLEKAKKVLLDSAYNLYDCRKDDLDLDILSFEIHYKNLGAIIFQIECYESFGDVIQV